MIFLALRLVPSMCTGRLNFGCTDLCGPRTVWPHQKVLHHGKLSLGSRKHELRQLGVPFSGNPVSKEEQIGFLYLFIDELIYLLWGKYMVEYVPTYCCHLDCSLGSWSDGHSTQSS